MATRRLLKIEKEIEESILSVSSSLSKIRKKEKRRQIRETHEKEDDRVRRILKTQKYDGQVANSMIRRGDDSAIIKMIDIITKKDRRKTIDPYKTTDEYIQKVLGKKKGTEETKSFKKQLKKRHRSNRKIQRTNSITLIKLSNQQKNIVKNAKKAATK